MALGLPSVVFAGAIALAGQFDLLNASLQFEEHFAWLDTIGMTYHLGVDGLSLPVGAEWLAQWNCHLQHLF